MPVSSVRQGFGVHVRHHQQRTVRSVGNDRSHQAVRVEARREDRTFFEYGLVGMSWANGITVAALPGSGAGRREIAA